jgi:predicted TIM-barrel fold metal-dependent hydrolase
MTDDLTIIDADGHIYEDMAAWAAYMPKGWTGPRPALLVGDDGIERFIIGDVYAMPARDTNQKGKMSIGDAMTPRDRGLGKASTSGRRLADAAPGGCDPNARLEVMEVEGIAVSILFPSFALAGLPAIALNDWTAEQVGSAEPGRFVAVASIPLHDPKFAAHELERCVRQLNVPAG